MKRSHGISDTLLETKVSIEGLIIGSKSFRSDEKHKIILL